ncbi:MAG: cysteine dioxygenase family protein [Candidatus Baltobacteraceae bacterium]
MISRSSIAELAAGLERFQRGGADAEIVRWLTAQCAAATRVPKPAKASPEHGYTRTLLHKTEQFEIVVIHWPPHCVTPVHDHGGALCWFAVADGTVGVENYVRCDAGTRPGYAQIQLDGRESLYRGGIDSRSDDVHLHRCLTEDHPATTLHVYARPIEHFLTFDEKANSCLNVDSRYDAVLAP